MNPKLSKYIIVFGKNHDTQYALLKMIEPWRSKLNCENKIGGLIMELSKPLVTMNHNRFSVEIRSLWFQ